LSAHPFIPRTHLISARSDALPGEAISVHFTDQVALPKETIVTLYLAEVLKLGLDNQSQPSPTMYPERRFVQPRQAALKKSMLRAGGMIGALALAGFGAAWLKRRRQ
jgi:hypothetical protein